MIKGHVIYYFVPLQKLKPPDAVRGKLVRLSPLRS